MSLTDEVAAVHGERGRPAAMVGELRRTAVLVPTAPRRPTAPTDAPGEDSLLSVEFGGIRWICAFTDEAALARFAAARRAGGDGKDDGAADWEYRTVLGARLLDVVVPAVGVPAGVALDVGSEHPMMFPPVVGIVPDAAAVDAPENWRPADPKDPNGLKDPNGPSGPNGPKDPSDPHGPSEPECESPEGPR
ncbi:SseB family protein [Streptomyces sp. NPDC057654]|uniref:SseB family protein n=1 Tax=Streptomyces sp. NPDC057654 TaxID=3346196 RepID=UPI0036A05B8F